MPSEARVKREALAAVHARMDACRACPKMTGPAIHGPAILSRVLAIGQAPGPHEGRFGKPFAWTAGKTLFTWFESIGVDENAYRAKVYMAAVARCFPGKDRGGGDRKPDPLEIVNCRTFIEEEVAILKPRLVIPIGLVAIEQILGRKVVLVEVVGKPMEATWHGARVDLLCLPHPSGLSTWYRTEPGKTMLRKALARIAAHPEWRRTFPARG